MSQITDKKLVNIPLWGFTLVELLVAVSILGLISIVAVQSLYDSLSIRSNQKMIEDSSDSFRLMTRLITRSVIEAREIEVSSDSKQIKVVSTTSCSTIRFDEANGVLLLSATDTLPCTPPDSGFTNISGEDLLVTNFTATPTGENVEIVNLSIEGKSYDSMGEHEVSYKTSITPRN